MIGALLFALVLDLGLVAAPADTLESCLLRYGRGDYAGAILCASAIEQQQRERQASETIRNTPPPLMRQRLRQLAALDAEARIEGGYRFACAVPFPSGDLLATIEPRRKPYAVEQLERGWLGQQTDWEFLKQWYVLAAAYSQGHEYLAGAKECLESAPAQLRQDPVLLLAMGSLSEQQCSRSSGRQRRCAEAERLYRAALATAPEHAETKLRLGKVMVEQGRITEALAVLLPLTASAETRISHLARMFAGLGYERSAEPVEAQRQYESAESTGSTTSSTLSLAGLAYRSGDRDTARRLLTRGEPRASDPWLAYTKGIAWNAATYRAELRALANQR